MPTTRQSAITQHRRKRLHERAQANQAPKQAEQAEPAKAETAPRVVGYSSDEPAWARPDWKPAATTNASDLLERHQRAQVWAELRARYAGDDGDPYRRRIPAGYDWLTGHKL